jgi:quercetin dioxygenase-like cupin family protein
MTMSKMRLKLSVGVFVGCAFGLIALRVAWATPSQGLSTTILTGPVQLGDIDLKSDTDDHQVKIKTKGPSDVYIVQNRIVPGGSTGWHSHPGISFVTVRSGQATEYHGDDPATSHVYPAGTGFTEEAGGVHLIRNEGTTDLELIAFQLIPSGATRRIDAPQP